MKSYKSGCAFLLAIFMFSLIPDVMVQHLGDQGADLKETISNLQRLAHQTDSEESDFASVYTNAVLTLRQAAGIRTIFVKSHDEQTGDSVKAIFIIIISLPFILSSIWHNIVILLSRRITIFEKQIFYISVSITPSIPPPEVSCVDF